METITTILGILKAHPELTTLIVGLALEIVTRKWPGATPFLQSLSNLLDKTPGLKNKE